MKIEELLKQSELFKNISDGHRKQVAERGRLQKYSPNEMIFLEGDEGEFFYLLVQGAVKLFKSGYDGKEIIVKLVQPGEIFAEVIIFETVFYPVSSMAVTESRLFALGRGQFNDLLDNPDFRREFMGFLMKKQRYLTQRILYLTAFDLEERFFRFLQERYGKHYFYEITLSKKDFASAMGTIPETFSRLIQRLGKRGLIEWKGNSLSIVSGFWDDYYPDL